MEIYSNSTINKCFKLEVIINLIYNKCVIIIYIITGEGGLRFNHIIVITIYVITRGLYKKVFL